MPFSPAADLPAIADGLSTAQLRRADTGALTALVDVLPRQVTQREAAASGGAVAAGDVIWHIPHAALADAPRLGDQILTVAGPRYTILKVLDSPLLGRWRCATRNLALAAGLCEPVTLQAAAWTIVDDVVTQTWTNIAIGVLAKLHPLDRRAHDQLPGRWRDATHRIALEEPLTAAADYRVVTAAGRVYHVLACEQPDRIDALPYLLALETTERITE